jgi:hypothetical protein
MSALTVPRTLVSQLVTSLSMYIDKKYRGRSHSVNSQFPQQRHVATGVTGQGKKKRSMSVHT